MSNNIVSNEIFQCSEVGETLRIEFFHRYLDYFQLTELHCLQDIISGRKVEITGPTSVEVYFLTGYWLTLWHASSITGINAHEESLSIELDKPLRTNGKKWLRRYENGNGQEMLDIVSSKSPTGKWSYSDLDLNTLADLGNISSASLHITGLGSVLMYLLLGISAAKSGLKDVFIAKPSIPYEIHITADGQCEAAAIAGNTRHGIVIGILGDPNSGKSVFSRNFSMTIRKILPEFASWMYDCDLASPTPEWYLTDSDAMKQKRQNIKQKWTTDLELKVVTDLGNLRHNLDLTLADMPGGRRREDGSLDRIPSESRAEMMAACNAFIVLCRKDQADVIFNAWKNSLSKWHLEDRIIAKLISSDPDGPLTISSVSENGIFTAEISGLDRKKDFDEVIQIMRTGLDKLVRRIITLFDAHSAMSHSE